MIRLLVSTIGIAVLGVLAWSFLRSPDSEEPSASPEERAAPADPATVQTGAALERTTADERPRTVPLSEFLADFHGDRWGEVEQEMRLAGIDTEEAWDPSGFPKSWEEVAEEVRKSYVLSERERQAMAAGQDDWPDKVTEEFVRARFSTELSQLTARELDAIDEIAGEHQDEIDGLVEAWSIALADAVQDSWDAEQFHRAPVFLPSTPKPPGTAFFNRSLVNSGWCVSTHVMEADHEEVPRLREMAEEAARERDRSVQEYLDSLK